MSSLRYEYLNSIGVYSLQRLGTSCCWLLVIDKVFSGAELRILAWNSKQRLLTVAKNEEGSPQVMDISLSAGHAFVRAVLRRSAQKNAPRTGEKTDVGDNGGCCPLLSRSSPSAAWEEKTPFRRCA